MLKKVRTAIRDKGVMLLFLLVFWILIISFVKPFSAVGTDGNQAVFLAKILLWILIILGSLTAILLVNEKSWSRNFLIISVFCLLFLIINPFYHDLDESTHFFRSLSIAEGELIDIQKDGAVGAYLPDNYETFDKSIATVRLSIRSLIENSQWLEPMSSQLSFSAKQEYSSAIPLPHILGAVGIKLALLFHLPFFLVVLLGRLSFYLAYVLISYFAIRRAKWCKAVIFSVALLPICIWLGASYSVDPLLNATCFFFLMIIANNLYSGTDPAAVKTRRRPGQQTIGMADMALLIVCSAVITMSKFMAYTPLLLLIFCIPKERYHSRRERLTFYTIEVIAVAGMLFWTIFMLKLYPYTETRNGDVNVRMQLAYVLSNLWSSVKLFIKVFLKNICYWYFNPRLHITGVFPWLNRILLLLPFFCSIFSCTKNSFSPKKSFRFVLFLSVLLTTALIMVSLYLGFTPVGTATEIQGIQDRYFIPLLFCIALALFSKKIVLPLRNPKTLVASLSIIALANALGQMMQIVFRR